MTIGLSCDVELTMPAAGFSDVMKARQFEAALSGLGPKHRPTYIDGVQLHPDSLACEFALEGPASTVGEFMMKFQHAREIAQSVMGMHLVGYDAIDTRTLPLLNPDLMPVCYTAANTFGCSPAWVVLRSGKPKYRNIVPDVVRNSTVKGMGFHFHFNLPEDMCDEEDGTLCARAVSTFCDRTQMLHTSPGDGWYRKPRVYRPKKYGMEYRSFGAGLADNHAQLEMAVIQAFRLMEELGV